MFTSRCEAPPPPPGKIASEGVEISPASESGGEVEEHCDSDTTPASPVVTSLVFRR